MGVMVRCGVFEEYTYVGWGQNGVTVTNRPEVAKNYKAKEVDGKVEKISDLSQINVKEGKWLILARTGSRLKNIMDELKRRGIYCATKKEKSFSEKLYRTILTISKYFNNVNM